MTIRSVVRTGRSRLRGLRPPSPPAPNRFINFVYILIFTSPVPFLLSLLLVALPVSSSWYTVQAFMDGKPFNGVVFGLMALVYWSAWYLFVTQQERFYLAPRATAALDTPESRAVGLKITHPNEPLTPVDYYRKIWQAVSNNFLFASQDTNDYWNALAAPPTTVDTFQKVAVFLRKAIHCLPDSYSGLLDQPQAHERQHKYDDKQLVSHRLLKGNVGYIRLQTFSRVQAVADMQDALEKLAGAGAYILDLRGNSGGLDTVARSIFSLLAEQGKFHHARSRCEGIDVTEDTVLTADGFVSTANGVMTSSPRRKNLIGSKSLFVLVNGSSASASEILAAALKAVRPATIIVGEKTFGKAVGQVHFLLDFGALLVVTSCAFLDAKGETWHKTGIPPDVSVPRRGFGDNQLSACLRLARRAIAEKTQAKTDPLVLSVAS